MVGDTNHDLIVKGKIWEVKQVQNSGGPFRGAKESKLKQAGTKTKGTQLLKPVGITRPPKERFVK